MLSTNAWFNLNYNPFMKRALSIDDCFQSRDFKEMYGALEYSKDARGIAVFTSPPGSGKTCVLKAFKQSLNPNLYRMDYLCLSTVSIAEFYDVLY